MLTTPTKIVYDMVNINKILTLPLKYNTYLNKKTNIISSKAYLNCLKKFHLIDTLQNNALALLK